MLYNEFIEGTKCKDNEHNYKVYKDLELIYMNSDITKQEIYEYGKKLVDNSKTEEQIALEEKIKAEISEYKKEIKSNRNMAKHYKIMASISEGEDLKRYRTSIRNLKTRNKELRNRVMALNWVLE